MLVSRSARRPLCISCQAGLLNFFSNGFSSTITKCKSDAELKSRPRLTQACFIRTLHSTKERRESSRVTAKVESTGEAQDSDVDETLLSASDMEAVVRQARQVWGETLPENHLSSEEYKIYERLYGPCLRGTQPEDVAELSREPEAFQGNNEPIQNTLLKENDDGDLEEVAYVDDSEIEDPEAIGTPVEEKAQDSDSGQRALYKDMLAAMREEHFEEAAPAESDPVNYNMHSIIKDEESISAEDELDDAGDFDGSYGDVETVRSHPLSTAGSFSTSPTTIHLPRESFVMPITAMLATSSNKHLTEVAQKCFGGPGLPNSTATPSSKRHLKQAPVALEASQPKMGDMEANAYLTAIMPGSYASIMGALVEVRKRLGSEWIEELLKMPGGPRILDAGAGGAGVLAWREVLRAEWERLCPSDALEANPVPLGKATVVTGSSELRERASLLLENTTFLPRLPDFVATRDLPIPSKGEPSSRKQYDIVLAPHTLWTIREDYMRKAQVQNLWSLLNPSGGILIIIEKGLPRGFELVAGAREVLLKHHISSPGSTQVENEIQNQAKDRFTEKEEGMIVAPCTNHTSCPMYTFYGQSKGRKDHCHFSQRFIRPPYLQHILGARDRNYEDVRFSYIAVQRGKDRRRIQRIDYGDSATQSAFEGYENDRSTPEDLEDTGVNRPETSPSDPIFFTLPRAIMPPLKRRGHVVLDLCTPSGKIERWTVPKSFSKQAYRDARKSKWGDLWALGAKTRVERTPRVGTKEGKPKSKRIIEVGIADRDEDNVIREISPNRGVQLKKGRKGRKERPRKLSKELEDLL